MQEAFKSRLDISNQVGNAFSLLATSALQQENRLAKLQGPFVSPPKHKCCASVLHISI